MSDLIDNISNHSCNRHPSNIHIDKTKEERPNITRFPITLNNIHFYHLYSLIFIMGYIAHASSLSAVSSLLQRFPYHNRLARIPRTQTKIPQHCSVVRQQFILSTHATISYKHTQSSSSQFANASSSDQRRKPRIKRQPQSQQPQKSHHIQQQSQNRQYSNRSKDPKLERPEVIFSNNHLLVVNKPAGWKSQPGNVGGQSSSVIDPKCLLTYLKSQGLGGGLNKDFLITTHRLDQPCTGVLIFAKNGKAASRVQVAWSKQKVKKCYWVVVEGSESTRSGKMNGLELLQSRSVHLNGSTYRLSAVLKSTKGGNGKNTRRGGGSMNNAGGSVMVKQLPPNYSENSNEGSNNNDGRVCHIEWKHLLTLPPKSSSSSSSNTRHLLSVTTDTGAKHQVRALLALAGGAPISGDLRYGDNHNSHGYQQGRVDQPLPDGSVALHARDVYLPTVSLGSMEFLKDKPFVATIPKRWREFFGISEDDTRRL